MKASKYEALLEATARSFVNVAAEIFCEETAKRRQIRAGEDAARIGRARVG